MCVLDEMKDCPNIVKCFEIVKTKEFMMIFFEYCNLGTLNDLVSNGKVPDHILQYMLR